MRSKTSPLSFRVSLSIVILCFAVAVFAAATNTLSVKCVDDSGKALSGARVQVLSLLAGAKPLEKKTDNNGVARFEKVEDGAYRVVARPEGLAPGLAEVIVLKNSAQESVTIKCAAGDPLKKFYFEDTVLNQQAMQAMSDGVKMLQEGKLAEGEKLLRSSLEINPSNPPTLYFLGVALVQEKQWDAAKEVLQKASNLLSVLVPLTTGKDDKGVEVPSQFKQYQQSIDALLPQLPAFKLRVEGNDDMAAKNYKQAITKFEEALKMFPNDPDTYYNLAIAQAQEKMYDQATASVEKAIALKPDDKAFLDLKQRIANNAGLEKVRGVLTEGDTLFNKKDYASALKKYEEALPMLPDKAAQAALWIQIGKGYTLLKQGGPALEAYRHAIEMEPENAKYKAEMAAHYDALAELYIADKQYEQAFATYAEAGKDFFKLGQNWANKNENDLAIMAFERVLKADPQNAEAYYEMGMVYWIGKKDAKLAIENLTKYVELGKDPAHLDNAKSTLTVIQKKK